MKLTYILCVLLFSLQTEYQFLSFQVLTYIFCVCFLFICLSKSSYIWYVLCFSLQVDHQWFAFPNHNLYLLCSVMFFTSSSPFHYVLSFSFELEYQVFYDIFIILIYIWLCSVIVFTRWVQVLCLPDPYLYRLFFVTVYTSWVSVLCLSRSSLTSAVFCDFLQVAYQFFVLYLTVIFFDFPAPMLYFLCSVIFFTNWVSVFCLSSS